MRRLLALALALPALLPLPARAEVAPTGAPCGYVAAQYQSIDWYANAGEVHAGPISLGDSAASGSVTCTVNGGSVTGPVTSGVVALAPSPIFFDANYDVNVPVCTRLDVTGGGSWYFDYPTRTWTTSATAQCTAAPPDAVRLPFPSADALLCPAFGGDVYVAGELVWDCPPYES